MPALPDGDTTFLVITGIDIPPYSARGLTQTLVQIDQSKQFRRTINGMLVDVSDPIFRKYSSTITGDDQQPPSLNGVWPGMTVVVDCAYEISYLTDSGTIPEREVVEGSERTDGLFTLYRPRLTMMVTDFGGSYAEWQASNTWTLALIEI